MISSDIKASFDASAKGRSGVKVGALGHIRPNAPRAKHLIHTVARHYPEPAFARDAAFLARRDRVAREELDGPVMVLQTVIADDLAGKGSVAEIVNGRSEAMLGTVVAANKNHCVYFDACERRRRLTAQLDYWTGSGTERQTWHSPPISRFSCWNGRRARTMRRAKYSTASTCSGRN